MMVWLNAAHVQGAGHIRRRQLDGKEGFSASVVAAK
jgi:hypothetical protein